MTRRNLLRYSLAFGAWQMRLRAQTAALSGAGASFPEPIYTKWFAAFAARFPGQTITYTAVGSGKGVELLQTGMVDFAASDHPLSKEVQAAMPGRVRHIPTVVGGLVPLYRLDGVTQPVRFTPEILAGISLGTIRRWNDPALRAANRGVPLPAADILVVHRSDRSGTTYIWTQYLSGVSAQWKASVGIGDQVKWPVQDRSATGSAGVLGAVAEVPNSFGYVEFTYGLDHRVGIGEVLNRDGTFVRADLTTLIAAASTVEPESFLAASDIAVNITNGAGRDAYPIAAFTYLLVPDPLADSNKQAAMRALLRWVLTSGQKQSAALGYAALPPAVAAQVLKTLEGA